MAIRSVKYMGDEFLISYDKVTNKANKVALFLHGWGSSKELMKSVFAKTLPQFDHYYVDLPGFGNSTIPKALNSYEYHKILKLFLKELNIEPDMIIGHSFGGKIATLLNPPLLILLSSAGIFRKKSISIRMKIYIFKILKRVGLGKFYKLFASKDVKNADKTLYETFKKVVDEDFKEEFVNFKNKALIFWGVKDRATPLASGKMIESLIEKSHFYALDGDHFFFLNSANFIEQTIRKNCENI